MDEKLGFEEDKVDNHQQRTTPTTLRTTMQLWDSCGEDCVEAVMVEKVGVFKCEFG
ncbi:hypothetical protein Pint_32822 [Pistacia integerrima]|uniref:Uncharacterized protein n=1 Tax=Pistacia integerrima TaxID=434235 RepID=A0ACC0X3S1_9ROSI|nr:hypothetical protein Pint_32822 [Pistacia integerrima]